MVSERSIPFGLAGYVDRGNDTRLAFYDTPSLDYGITPARMRTANSVVRAKLSHEAVRPNERLRYTITWAWGETEEIKISHQGALTPRELLQAHLLRTWRTYARAKWILGKDI